VVACKFKVSAPEMVGAKTKLSLFLCLAAGVGLAGAICLPALAAGPRSNASVSLCPQVREADDYFLGRRNLENVQKAIQLLGERVANNPNDYEAWWRVSKFNSYMARHSDGKEEDGYLDAGVAAGRKAVALAPNRPEGHFWLGANLGLQAEDRGFLRGLTMVDSIRKEMEITNRLDPDYEEAGAQRTLARIDYRAPFFKGGDKKRSIQMLKEVLTRYPHNSLAMLYLADSYMALGRRHEARQQLENILSLCPDPTYGPEQEDNQAEARERLTEYFAKN
jgi:cytochrome c-type biogenesis protein CcmH/NrfG